MDLLNPEGRAFAIGNRGPGRVGLMGSAQGIYMTPPGHSRPPLPKAASPMPSNPHMRLWKSSTKIINYRSFSASYFPPTHRGSWGDDISCLSATTLSILTV